MSIRARVRVKRMCDLPINGMDAAAGGVDSASNSNRTKKATKMFIPAIKTHFNNP